MSILNTAKAVGLNTAKAAGLNTVMAAGFCLTVCACATPQTTSLASNATAVPEEKPSPEPAPENTTADQNTPTTETAEADGQKKNRRVCKTEKVTGSRFAKKTCRTATQWQEMKEQSQKDLQRLQRRPG